LNLIVRQYSDQLGIFPLNPPPFVFFFLMTSTSRASRGLM
jgi:hypothetical protein